MAEEMDGITLTLSREQMAEVGMLAEMVRGGALRDPRTALAMGEAVSYRRGQFAKGRLSRVFAHPDAARRVAKVLGRERARSLLGNKAYRDAALLFAQPTDTDVHIDVPLTQISVRYQNPEYIGTSVFPRVQVTDRSDKFFIYDNSGGNSKAWLRNDAKPRAVGGATARGGYELSTGSYSVIQYGFEHPIPDEVRKNSDSPLAPDADAINFCMDKVAMAQEKIIAALVNTSGNWTTNVTLSGTGQWSDYTNSNPFTDFKTARITIRQQVARPANTIQMGIQTFEALALHPELLDRVKYTGTSEKPAMVTSQMMAALFMVDQVLVGGAVEETANEGATSSPSFIWGKHAWIGFVAPSPALATPSAGYIFSMGVLADRYREDWNKADVVRCLEDFDAKAVAAGAGYRLINAVA